MNYYKSTEKEDSITYVFSYYEGDDDRNYRQISLCNGEVTASNIMNGPWSPQLGMTSLSFADEDAEYWADRGLVRITKEEFDEVWNAHLERRRPLWEKAKANYQPGTPVAGTLLIFFPQGALVDLGDDAIGVVAFEQWMYPQHKMAAIAAGYDEQNQWIKLQEPQVLEETVG